MEIIRATELRADGMSLEPLRVEHADEMVAVLTDESIYEFTGGDPPTRDSLRDRYEFQSQGESPDGSQSWLNWIIRITETGEAAGYVQASVSADAGQRVAEIAWVVGPPFQGRGIATTATRAMGAFLREHGVERLIAHVHPDHPASQGVARAVGLHPTDVIVDGEVRWRDDVSNAHVDAPTSGRMVE